MNAKRLTVLVLTSMMLWDPWAAAVAAQAGWLVVIWGLR